MNKDKKYTVFQNLSYCIHEAGEAYPRLLLFCALIVLINCAVPTITTFLPRVVINEITGKATILRLLTVTAVMTGSLAILTGLQKYLDRLIYWHKFKVNAFFLRKVTKKGLTTDYRNQEDEHFRKLQHESFACCNGNFSYFIQILDATVQFLSNILGLAAFFGILAALNPILIVFLCVTSLVSFFLNNRLNKWVAVNTEERVGYEQRMQYVISATNDMQAAKDIRLYNMAVWLNGIYEKNLKGVIGWYKKYTSKLFRVSAADSGFSLLREGVTYAFLLYMVLKKNLSVADFVLYFGVAAGFSAWLNSLLSQLTHISGLNLSVNRIRSYLEYPEVYLRDGGAPLPDKESPSEICLENVSFRYKEDGEDILKNISITLKPGEHLAVVGLNGAGKTTMVKLMCGLTEPSSGRVLYNGRDIREYNRDEYYRLFGAVFQDYSLMPVTIEEIVAEDVAGKIDREKVKECLKTAGLWDKVASLKGGILSKYDKSFWDDGINLSGGEIQKLLLARALYRQSPVIILDEPTAALDPVSENRLYETYDEVMKGKSTFFISHRLASTRFCDRILLIENGRIAEEGTHEELLNKKGRYYELFETQAKYYRENPEGKEDADEA